MNWCLIINQSYPPIFIQKAITYFNGLLSPIICIFGPNHQLPTRLINSPAVRFVHFYRVDLKPLEHAWRKAHKHLWISLTPSDQKYNIITLIFNYMASRLANGSLVFRLDNEWKIIISTSRFYSVYTRLRLGLHLAAPTGLDLKTSPIAELLCVNVSMWLWCHSRFCGFSLDLKIIDRC